MTANIIAMIIRMIYNIPIVYTNSLMCSISRYCMISSMINKTTAPKLQFEVKSPIYSLAGDY